MTTWQWLMLGVAGVTGIGILTVACLVAIGLAFDRQARINGERS